MKNRYFLEWTHYWFICSSKVKYSLYDNMCPSIPDIALPRRDPYGTADASREDSLSGWLCRKRWDIGGSRVRLIRKALEDFTSESGINHSNRGANVWRWAPLSSAVS